MKRQLMAFIAAVTLVLFSCNPSKTTTTTNDSNYPGSTTDTATTNNVASPDSTLHR